jgi:two-component system, chemotaxis family, protein-glutamate methylesterase/glutaminase
MGDLAPPLPVFDVVALVASAGGLSALSAVLSQLPAEFPAAVVVVQHLDPTRPSLLAKILGQRTGLPVSQARHGDRLRPGAVFVASPNRHLVVGPDGVLALTATAPVHHARPSADTLLESVGRSFGPRAVAVVLSGAGSDGSNGVRVIKKMGGTVIAQDRPSSQSFGMPGAAIHTGCVDSVLPLGEIAPALVHLVTAIAQAEP